MEDQETVLDEAVDGFRRRAGGIAWRWEEPTPCEEWSVLDLVEHVITGNALAVHLLEGGSAGTAPPPPQTPEAATALQRFEHSARLQREAFSRASTLGKVCDHPAGRVTGRELLRYRAADIAVHTWDLARALGLDEALDPLVVETAISHYLPWIASMPSSSHFRAPDGLPPAGASAQHRLLHAVGRPPVR
ncbi:TIGR03086 family metal-binding protein [Pseudokineococcus sp. 1T1Z-3]|uniref:TIGR03086 family metal-binding protein n=1 Tax=Pseudokineococcus sp. 1T1Z-3 TaxID=3132745 RepID=UPI0030AAFBC9